MAKSRLIDSLRKNKALQELIRTDDYNVEYLSTNCASVNLLVSGKINGRNQKR